MKNPKQVRDSEPFLVQFLAVDEDGITEYITAEDRKNALVRADSLAPGSFSGLKVEAKT